MPPWVPPLAAWSLWTVTGLMATATLVLALAISGLPPVPYLVLPAPVVAWAVGLVAIFFSKLQVADRAQAIVRAHHAGMG